MWVKLEELKHIVVAGGGHINQSTFMAHVMYMMVVKQFYNLLLRNSGLKDNSAASLADLETQRHRNTVGLNNDLLLRKTVSMQLQ